MEPTPVYQLLDELLGQASDEGLELCLSRAHVPSEAERPLIATEYAQRYQRTVASVAARRGAPSFAGGPGDHGYPGWSTGSAITTWSDPTGIVYVALCEHRGAPELVAGARPHPYDRETITLMPPST